MMYKGIRCHFQANFLDVLLIVFETELINVLLSSQKNRFSTLNSFYILNKVTLCPEMERFKSFKQ